MQRIGAILLLFLFSFSMMSFNVKLHYCKGDFKSLAFIGKAECETCDHHQKKHAHCEKHDTSAPCCETIILSHNGAEDFLCNDYTENDNFQGQIIAIIDKIEQSSSLSLLTDPKLNYRIYPPPEYWFDFQIFFQTYLI